MSANDTSQPGQNTVANEALRELWEKIMAQREEIAAAFIAKYGIQPDQVEQVVRPCKGGVRWYLRRRLSR